ncbi:bifunctional 3'-5' exonuclease/DNA polymerase [Arthrobacter sp. NPDC090010]|uniref:bifunctional 3'-5' exonuclease/DNA polymerase n=1 Tax=Arthrobacter sp. NPDC090010 TaxID=3363942 RepID=UPI0038114DC7
MHILLASGDDGTVHLARLDASGVPLGEPWQLSRAALPKEVSDLEATEQPRWVWDSSSEMYPPLLAAGVRLGRCHDVTLARTILRFSQLVQDSSYAALATELTGSPAYPVTEDTPLEDLQESLFEAPRHRRTAGEIRAEFAAQLDAVQSSRAPVRLRLLLAAESAASLVAAEMQSLGVPWDPQVHRELLSDALGPEPAPGRPPARMEELAQQLRAELRAPQLNPDSPQDLLKALHRNGIEVRTTRQWELQSFNHPAIAPLLEYKKLARLYTANGWAWLEAWIRNGRFRPDYVVGGVVTGRWASRGGGALQIPRTVRRAARALPGYKLLVADASQVEPRILAAMSGDAGMAAAAREQDLYAEIADAGFGGSRSSAKVALLGAMYGATTGESARLMPQLRKLYPRAIALVEDAARQGERGESVSTWLGRSTPPPGPEWDAAQRTQSQEEQRRADAWARSRGRFTRNFIVQGTAAEWAECWLAGIRSRIAAFEAPEGHEETVFPPTGPAELVFFLHDEIMIHAPAELIPRCVAAVEEAAREAGRLLFGKAPVDFPLTVAVVDSYDQAK